MEPRLMLGDCLEIMPTLQNGSVDMVLADLPFGTTRQSWDKVIDPVELWREYRRVVKPDGAIVLFAKPPFDKVLAASNLAMYRYDWIWEKTRATGHLNASRMPLQAHEYICVFYQRQPECHPQKTDGHKPVNAYYTRHSGLCYGGAEKLQSGGGNTDRHPRSVIKCAPVPNNKRRHANQKPLELLVPLILTYTSPGQVVLDNTMGSGSTMEACIETGRMGIGIEKDVKIYERAEKFITSKLALSREAA
ncbi:DNA methylase [Aeromonas salmonicida subsp. salmonicida]|nr:DNA methylase [Aeromonas salmonicida subsp. salmonicida]KHE98626.1 DNA methylase [Aeromonas salmonicida subsp. salmonicida]PJZ08194.1 DNA methylase [Aeromonas salmonicida subsp. salmonicida]RYJ26716.1 DNA methylase [Aeromonas salmonicida subsp. salmonicida]TKY43340.1 DNA methylase [Aeromonas salmonicida subsp. salmonicida]